MDEGREFLSLDSLDQSEKIGSLENYAGSKDC